MKTRIRVCGLVVAVILGVCAVSAQGSQGPPSREAILSAARGLIDKVGFATLITLDATGGPQSRIVDPFPVEPDWIVWIATTAASRKVAEIVRDPRVALTYFDPADPGYVALTGTAAIVKDPAEKAKRWKDAWVGFYKDRNRGEDYTLIRVTVNRLEISSRDRKMNNDPLTWRPVTLTIR